ncbi:hypothetical protein EDB83DRAFT_2622741 [Lactarius deliciosus]|nr:hypothetical protein EDB83DRAFT_2622741 [Lactarius deliciosus]
MVGLPAGALGLVLPQVLWFPGPAWLEDLGHGPAFGGPRPYNIKPEPLPVAHEGLGLTRPESIWLSVTFLLDVSIRLGFGTVSRRQWLGQYAERDQGQGAKAQGREGIPQDIKAKGFIREHPSTYTTRAGAFKPSNPNTQPRILITQSNHKPYKSAVTSVTYHTPVWAQAHPDPSGPALGRNSSGISGTNATLRLATASKPRLHHKPWYRQIQVCYIKNPCATRLTVVGVGVIGVVDVIAIVLLELSLRPSSSLCWHCLVISGGDPLPPALVVGVGVIGAVGVVTIVLLPLSLSSLCWRCLVIGGGDPLPPACHVTMGMVLCGVVVKENLRVAKDGGGRHGLTWQDSGSDNVALRRGENDGDVGEYCRLVGKYPGNNMSRGGKCDRNEYQMSIVDHGHFNARGQIEWREPPQDKSSQNLTGADKKGDNVHKHN